MKFVEVIAGFRDWLRSIDREADKRPVIDIWVNVHDIEQYAAIWMAITNEFEQYLDGRPIVGTPMQIMGMQVRFVPRFAARVRGGEVSEMVERVANAIEAALPRITEFQAVNWTVVARAAIEVMGKPTEEMKDAGLLIGESIEPSPERVWCAMNDAALK